jgi:hypothetical protein
MLATLVSVSEVDWAKIWEIKMREQKSVCNFLVILNGLAIRNELIQNMKLIIKIKSATRENTEFLPFFHGTSFCKMGGGKNEIFIKY